MGCWKAEKSSVMMNRTRCRPFVNSMPSFRSTSFLHFLYRWRIAGIMENLIFVEIKMQFSNKYLILYLSFANRRKTENLQLVYGAKELLVKADNLVL